MFSSFCSVIKGFSTFESCFAGSFSLFSALSFAILLILFYKIYKKKHQISSKPNFNPIGFFLRGIENFFRRFWHKSSNFFPLRGAILGFGPEWLQRGLTCWNHKTGRPQEKPSELLEFGERGSFTFFLRLFRNLPSKCFHWTIARMESFLWEFSEKSSKFGNFGVFICDFSFVIGNSLGVIRDGDDFGLEL